MVVALHVDDHPSLAERIHNTTEAGADLAFLDVQGRVAKKLLDLAAVHGRRVGQSTEIDLPIRQADLAGMVGASRASVSKILSWAERRGILRPGRRHITVLDPDRLRRLIVDGGPSEEGAPGPWQAQE